MCVLGDPPQIHSAAGEETGTTGNVAANGAHVGSVAAAAPRGHTSCRSLGSKRSCTDEMDQELNDSFNQRWQFYSQAASY